MINKLKKNTTYITNPFDLMRKAIHKSSLLVGLLFLLVIQCGTEETKQENNSVASNENIPINEYLQEADSLKLKLEYDNAFKLYQKVIDITGETKDTNNLFLTYVKVSEMYRYLGKFKKSESYLNKANLIINSTLPKNRMHYYNRKAALNAQFYPTPDTTIYYSNKALALAYEYKDSNIMFLSTMEIGATLENTIGHDTALHYFKKALELAENLKNSTSISNALIACCRSNKRLGKYEKLKLLSEKGYKIALDNNLLYGQLMFTKYFVDYYEIKKDYKTAHYYIRKYMDAVFAYRVKLYNGKIIETEKKYKLAEIKKETARKEKEIIQKNANIENQRKIIFLITTLLCVILIFSGIITIFFIKLKKRNKTLRFLNEQNNFLISETNHRVNNNLQLISVFLNKEIGKQKNNENEGMTKILYYIDSMAALHRNLYQNEDKRMVNLFSYANEIIVNLTPFLEENNVEVSSDFEKINLVNDQAMYVGFLINELIINSIKHAFKKEGDNKIKIKINSDGEYKTISYSDNGVGMTKHLEPITIIKICKQLNGEYTIDSQNKFHFQIKF